MQRRARTGGRWSRAARARAVLAVALVAGLAAPAPVGALVVGIADQKPAMFSDPRFSALEVRFARVSVGWDVLSHPDQTERLDAWLAAARAAGVDPLVSLGHSLAPGQRRVLPSPSRLKYELRRLRERYPQVSTFAAWNEANHCGEPTCHRPELVARYWRALRRECPSCRILAAEVLDMPNMESWVRAFERAAPEAAGPQATWGLHNYLDANRIRTSGTRRLLAITRGPVWFTETGGIVRRRNRVKVTFPESAEHAALATRWLFRRLVPLSPRVRRVYVYQWDSPSEQDTWDSALVGPDDRLRPAYEVLRRELARRAARRR